MVVHLAETMDSLLVAQRAVMKESEMVGEMVVVMAERRVGLMAAGTVVLSALMMAVMMVGGTAASMAGQKVELMVALKGY